MNIMFEPRSVWVGRFSDRRADGINHYVCPLPMVVIHWVCPVGVDWIVERTLGNRRVYVQRRRN